MELKWKELFPIEHRYFETKNGILYKSDNLKVMPEFTNSKVSLVLTDPPYNVSKTNNFKSMGGGRVGIDFGEWDKNFNQVDWLRHLKELVNKNGSIVIFNNFDNLSMTKSFLSKVDFEYKDFLVFYKTNAMPRNRERRYINSCEYAVWMVKKNSNWIFNMQNKKYDSNLITTIVTGGKEKTTHPTQKKLSVIVDLVKRHSINNDLVLDPFLGSGTTALACEQLNRRWIGIEIDETYCKITKQRINEYNKQIKLL